MLQGNFALNYARTYVNLMVIFMAGIVKSLHSVAARNINSTVSSGLRLLLVQNCYDISSLCSEKFDFVYLRTFPKMKDPFQTHC